MMIAFNLIGVFLIVLIIWWFWITKSKTTAVTSNIIKIEIKDGVYSPSRIEVKSEKPIIIEFIRKDNSPCSKSVVFKNLDKQVEIPFNKPFQVNLGYLNPGSYPFSCQMKMYTGELIVI